MKHGDLQLLVWSANEFEKYLAPLSKIDRAQQISDKILQAHICYAVWKDGEGYRLRRLKAISPPRDRVKISAGIPVVNEAHADLLEAAASHGAPMGICQ